MHKTCSLIAHLLPEVLQHVFTAASQVGLQQDSIPLLVMHGLSDLAAQEPEEKMADALTLRRKRNEAECER